MRQLDRSETISGPRVRGTLALCYLGIVIEGFDIATGGHVAKKTAAEFGLTPAELGLSFSANALGLLLGAIACGWLADRIGRKSVLIACFAVFGAMSLATTFTSDPISYFAVRFLTGLGLGGSVPNLIALSAEYGAPSTRMSRVTILSSGLPLGGALCGALSFSLPPDFDWRIFFIVGGAAPLLLAFLFATVIPHELHDPEARRSVHVLFEERRSLATLCLWVAFFLTMMTLALMINWLPTLIVGNGHSPRSAALATGLFSLAGACGGVLLGLAIGRFNRLKIFLCTYLAVMAGVGLVAVAAEDFTLAMLGSILSGFFLIAAQVLLYGLAPTLYPASVRATGAGFAVAAGRAGSIAGPLLAGIVLQLGGASSIVMVVTIPLMAVALAALVPVLRRAE